MKCFSLLYCASGFWVSFAALSPCRFRGPLLHAVPVSWGVVSQGLVASVRCESSVLGGTSRRLTVSLGSVLNSSHCPICVKSERGLIQVRFG